MTGEVGRNFVAGSLSGIIGRKLVLLSTSIILIASFMVLIVASEVWIIILGRVLQGIAMGFIYSTLPMYVSEISTDITRTATGSLMQLSTSMGTLYVYAIGPYVSYQALQIFCLAVPVVFAAAFIFMPESPYFYVSKNRLEDASKALQFLRGQPAEAVKETLASIENFVDQTAHQKGNVKDLFKNVGNRKAFVLSVGLMIFQQLSGNTVVLFNTQSIFEAANTEVDAAISAIIVGIVQIIGACLTPVIVERGGRKISLLVSTAAMSICLSALGAYFYTDSIGGDVSNLCWLPLTTLIISILMYSSSFGSLPLVMACELFTVNIKNLAFAAALFLGSTVGFLIIYFYPLLITFGTYYAFWLFSSCCLAAFFFILIFVFETKGLSFQQIQDILNNTK